MQIDRAEFLQVLESVKYGLSKKELIEQSGSFVFDAGEVATFNDEVCCRAPSRLDESVTGACYAFRLLDTLRKIPDDTLQVERDDASFVFKGKRKRFRVITESEIVLDLANVGKPKKWLPLPDKFLDAISLASDYAGTDDSRFCLTCVHVHPTWVESCDNMRIFRYRLKTGVSEAYLVRGDSIKNIVSLGMCEYSEADSWIHFRNPGKVIYSCRRFSEEYPSLDDYLKMKGTPLSITKELADAVTTAEIYSKGQADHDFVKVRLKANSIQITGTSSGGDFYEESRKVKYAGPEVNFDVSPKVLASLAENHSDCEIDDKRISVSGERWKCVALLSHLTDPATSAVESGDAA